MNVYRVQPQKTNHMSVLRFTYMLIHNIMLFCFQPFRSQVWRLKFQHHKDRPYHIKVVMTVKFNRETISNNTITWNMFLTIKFCIECLTFVIFLMIKQKIQQNLQLF